MEFMNMNENKQTDLKLLKWTPALVEHFWSLTAQSPLAQLSFSKLVCAELVEFIRREVPPPAKVLDFGAGDGDLADALLVAGYQVGVYEPSSGRSQVLLGKSLAKHPQFLGVYSKSSNEVFDAVLAFEVLEHLLPETVNQDMALIVQFLHSKGKLIGTVPLEESLEDNSCICPICSHYFHRWQHVRSFSSQSLTSFLVSHGISDIQACVTADFAVSLAFVAGKEPLKRERKISLTLPAPSLSSEVLSLRANLRNLREERAQLKRDLVKSSEEHAALFLAIGHLNPNQIRALQQHVHLTRLFSNMLRLIDEPILMFRVPRIAGQCFFRLLRWLRDLCGEVYQRCCFTFYGISWKQLKNLKVEKEVASEDCFEQVNEFSVGFKQKKPSLCLFKNGLSWGGAERQLVLTAKELKRRGCDVRVVLMHSKKEDCHYLPLLKEVGIPVSYLPGTHAIGKSLFELKKANVDFSKLSCTPIHLRSAIINLAADLVLHQADILHCYLDSNNVIGGWAGLFAKIPVIRMSGRNVNPSFFPWFYPGDYKKYYSELLKYPRIRLENNSSYGAKDYARWLGLPETSIEVNHNGLDIGGWKYRDVSERERMRDLLGISTQEFVVLTVFRCSSEKRPLDLVRVAAESKAKGFAFKFVHVGNRGEYKNTISADASERGVQDQMIFLDVRNDIPELMAMADVILLLSEHEGFPNVIMEAMASGLPVVSTNAGGVPELIKDGQNGFLHTPGDIQAIAKSLGLLYLDKDLQVRMGRANRKTIEEKFSIEKLGDRLLEAYTLPARKSGLLHV